jgi:hypothetical protein
MEVAVMEYRNIDQDIVLLKSAKRYWQEEITLDQLNWILKDQGYSEPEIDHAITDYYYVYLWPNVLINRLAWIIVLVIFGLILLVRTV